MEWPKFADYEFFQVSLLTLEKKVLEAEEFKRRLAFATQIIEGKAKTAEEVTAERCGNLAKARIVKEEKRRLKKATAKFNAVEKGGSQGNSNVSTVIITSPTLQEDVVQSSNSEKE